MKYNEEPEIWRWLRSKQAYNTGQGTFRTATHAKGGGGGGPDAAPTALIVTGMRDTELDLEWTINSTDHTGHRIYKSTDGSTFSALATVTDSTNTYTATGLTAGTVYYFYIVAYTASGESDPTDTYDTRFKITVDTTKAGSAADTFVLPVLAKGTGSYYVDWGAGGAEEEFTTTGNKSHTYAAAGSYQVKVRGVVTRIGFNNGGDKLKVTTLDNWGNIKISSLTSAFHGCSNMQGTYIDVPNTTASMAAVSTFNGCAKFNWPVPFITSSITNMVSTFYGCTIFNQSLSTWTTSNVTTFDSMMRACPAFDQDISHFNIEAATTMANMFNGSNAWSRANYDAALIAWAAQDVNDSVAFHAGDATYTAGGAAEAARTHLVSTHSWTITDGGPSFDNGKLVLTSDDGYASIYTTGFPALVAQGVAGTFYINSNNVGVEGRVTWAQLLEMHNAGMDIQCHFNDHTDLRSLNEAQVIAGLQDLDSDFTTNSLPAANHHAYPYGYFNDNVRAYVATERLTARTTQIGYTHTTTDKTQIPAEPCDDGYIDIAEAQVLLDHVKSEGKAIVMYGHRFGESGHINMTEFNAIIDYAQSIGVDIITMSQLYALMT